MKKPTIRQKLEEVANAAVERLHQKVTVDNGMPDPDEVLAIQRLLAAIHTQEAPSAGSKRRISRAAQTAALSDEQLFPKRGPKGRRLPEPVREAPSDVA